VLGEGTGQRPQLKHVKQRQATGDFIGLESESGIPAIKLSLFQIKHPKHHPCKLIQILPSSSEGGRSSQTNARQFPFPPLFPPTFPSLIVNPYQSTLMLASEWSFALFISQEALITHTLGHMCCFCVQEARWFFCQPQRKKLYRLHVFLQARLNSSPFGEK